MQQFAYKINIVVVIGTLIKSAPYLNISYVLFDIEIVIIQIYFPRKFSNATFLVKGTVWTILACILL